MTMLDMPGPRLFVIILLLAVTVEAVSNLNTTVDNTDLSIQYSPPTAWHSRTESAAIDEDSLSQTWHDGSLQFAGGETDSRPVVMEFEFTGSAIYVYARSPFSPSQITSTVDGIPLLYTPPHGTSNSAVLSRGGLSEAVHHLRLTVHNGALFSFDYLTYTRSAPSGDDQIQLNRPPRRRSVEDSESNDVPPPQLPQPLSSTTCCGPVPTQSNADVPPPHQPPKDVAVFAGAIGGVVGALVLTSLLLTISIIRRRRLARSRTQQATDPEGADVSSLYTDGSHDRPAMHGPAPFVPRYFPGTVLPPPPPPPPPYESRRSSMSTLPVASDVEHEQERRDSGYADQHPSPRLDGVVEKVEEERGQVAPQSSAAEDTVVYPQLPAETRAGSRSSIRYPPGLAKT